MGGTLSNVDDHSEKSDNESLGKNDPHHSPSLFHTVEQAENDSLAKQIMCRTHQISHVFGSDELGLPV